MLKAFLCLISHCIELSVGKNVYIFEKIISEKPLALFPKKCLQVITIVLEATR